MSFKVFVSENQLEENKKVRQAEWEKVRKPDDPEEAPEPEYDPRSLFDRLQEQKIKKQEEFEESRRLKNLICVLDQEETAFLEMVDKNKMDEEIAKAREEKAALEEFRKAIEGLTQDEQEKKINEFKTTFSLKGLSRKGTKRSLNGPLANLIKIKSSSSEGSKDNATASTRGEATGTGKDAKINESASDQLEVTSRSTKDTETIETKVKQSALKTCLVDYGSDSEDESNDDNQPEDETINHPNKKSKVTE